MYNNICEFINILKKQNIIQGNDMNYIFNKILKYSQNNEYYYKYSKDYQLLDFSFEYSWSKNKLENIFRFSYFWTNIFFIKDIFLYFWYKKNLLFFLEKYKNYLDFIKDDFLTCWFKFKDWQLLELKIYFDLNKDEKLLLFEKVDKDLLFINSNILLKSFTFNLEWLVEEKLYIPTDKKSLKCAEEKLKNNKEYNKFKKSDYYDILYRFKLETLYSIKFYYNIRDDFFLKQLIKDKFSYFIEREDFSLLNTKDELGVDFNLKSWINKYNYYIGLYK